MSATGRARANFKSYDDAVARIGATKQAADESRRSSIEDRAKRETDEKLSQDAKCTAESNNGKEPCGMELSRAFVKVSNMLMPMCRNLLTHEWCDISFGAVWVRWVGGNKLSCKQIDGSDSLLCDYTVDWDCKVRNSRTNEEDTSPMSKAMFCTAFTPVVLTAKATRVGKEWTTESVRNTENNGRESCSAYGSTSFTMCMMATGRGENCNWEQTQIGTTEGRCVEN
jgi:hypothetical protein